MASEAAIFSPETFRFFRELERNNHKPWMDANRERYRALVVEPMRVLLDRLAPAARKLNPRFQTSGRVGENFSRINRDIRFARDKSPYRTHMYLHFSEPDGDAQLYVGISPEAITAGFRAYGERTSPLTLLGRPRGRENSKWIVRQQKRLGNKYQSYWYATEKGEWVKHPGWPTGTDDWKKLAAWIVRRKFPPTAATRDRFAGQAAKIFREIYPIFEFTSSPRWKP